MRAASAALLQGTRFMHWRRALDQQEEGAPHQLWNVGAGRKGGQNGDHEQRGPNVDGIRPEILLANVPV